MNRITKTIEEFFEEDDWNYEVVEENRLLRTGISGEHARYRVFLDVQEKADRLVIYFVSPNQVPKEKLIPVAEFLTRANYGMIIGNFEMDYDDGEIRYKVSRDVEGETLSKVGVKNMIMAGFVMMDRYYPGIMGVIFGDKQPSLAIAEIEDSGVAENVPVVHESEFNGITN